MGLSGKSNQVAGGFPVGVACPVQIGSKLFAADAGEGLDRRAVLGGCPSLPVEPGPDVPLLDLAGLGGQGSREGGLTPGEADGLFEWGLHSADHTTLAVFCNTPCCLTETTLAVTLPAMNLGERVAAARDYAKLTQDQLAKRVGVSQQTIHKLESGKSDGTKAIGEICLVTGVSLPWLVRGEGQMLASQSMGPDPVILANTARVLHNIALMQAGKEAFDWTPQQCMAVYEALSRLSPDVDIDRAEVSRRMAAVLRGGMGEESMGRGDAVGAG